MIQIKNLINNEFYRNVFTLVSATSIAQVLAIIIYPILTRIYTTEDHGLFGLYMSIISITSIISTGKYELSVLLPKSHVKSINIVFLSILISFLFSVFLLILVIFFGKFFASALGDEKIYPWLFFIPLSTFLVAVFQSLSYWSNRHKRYRKIGMANMSQSLTNSITKVSSSGIFQNGGGLIIGALIGQLTGAIVFLADIFGKDRKKVKEINKKETIRVSREYHLFPKFSMMHYLVNNFSGSLPIFALSSFFSTGEAGLYSVAFAIIFRPTNLITNSLDQVFSQRLISKYNNNQDIIQDIKRLILRLIIIALIPFTLAALAGPRIISIILGDSWKEAGRYLQIILPWLFMVMISNPLSFLPNMLNQQKKAMWLDIIKFIFRLLAVGTGVFFGNTYILLFGFSISSALVTLFAFIWYIKLAKNAYKMKQQILIKPEISIPDFPEA